MADTNSHPKVFPLELSYVSFVVGLISFLLTVMNLLALYADMATTIRDAPHQIRDSLGNLREQILEEREALRQQTRDLRAFKSYHNRITTTKQQHPAHAGRPRSSSRSRAQQQLRPSQSNGTLRGGVGGTGMATASMYVLTHSEQTLSLHYQTVRDLWRRFKALERPFLVQSGARAEAIHLGAPWDEDDLVDEKGLREDVETHGEAGSWANYSAVYQCAFVHRFIWYQTKGEVEKLAEQMQAIMLRRIEREVTSCRGMLREITAPRGMRRPVGESWNVYESSEEESSESGNAVGGKGNGKGPQGGGGDERDATRVRVAEVRGQQMSPKMSPVRRGRERSEGGGGAGGYEYRYPGDGWRQGQFTRVVELPSRPPPPIILEVPRASRPRTRQGYERSPSLGRRPIYYDGPPTPYDARRPGSDRGPSAYDPRR